VIFKKSLSVIELQFHFSELSKYACMVVSFFRQTYTDTPICYT
jgi:hypothetical protein